MKDPAARIASFGGDGAKLASGLYIAEHIPQGDLIYGITADLGQFPVLLLK